jgi:protein phosphatase
MEPKVAILLIGAPGSGKTTWGKFYAESRGITRLCPDEFRAKFGTGEDDQTVSGIAFAATKSAMGNALELGKSVMIDATNMYRKTRKDFIKIARDRGASTMAIVFEANKETLLERNKNRGLSGGRNVPENVIDDMLSKYQRPEKDEFDAIQYITKIK